MRMKRYRNFNGGSGISEFEIGDDFIRVKFSDRSLIYTYSCGKAGRVNIEMMKKLAKSGRGLNTYLNQHVKDLFD